MTSLYKDPRSYRMFVPDRIDSGENVVNRLPKIIGHLKAKRILVASSNSVLTKTPNIKRIHSLIGDQVVCDYARCRAHAPEENIDELVDLLDANKIDAVVSIGGSSVFDAVKVAVSRSAALKDEEPIPQIAIPTTLSAGEFSPGAGFTEKGTGSKKLVIDTRVTPRHIILDPTVTIHTPAQLWLSSGVKALDHAMEAVWSRKPHPYVDALALDAIRLLIDNLHKSRDADDLEARAACQLAAWMSISGVGAAGMRLSHFLGHQIGAHMHIPHGITSCILLPVVMRYLRDETLEAQVRIAAAMGVEVRDRSSEEIADAAARKLEMFIKSLELPSTISAAGGSLGDIDVVSRSGMEAAASLGLTGDLPNGVESVRIILMQAWK